MSSAATSKQLSEATYPTFLRTVPSDEIQSKTIIWLCTQFGWDSIALFYHGDPYGVYLVNAIIAESLKEDINVQSVSYFQTDSGDDTDTLQSIEKAIERLQSLDVYICVLIPEISTTFDVMYMLYMEGMLDFPYFWSVPVFIHNVDH